MKRLCFWCATYMGEKGGNDEEGVFHSVCDDCAHKLKLEERLPELLQAVAHLRRQNGGKEQNHTSSLFTTNPQNN